ncbi:MAG: hypothetical protein ABR961_11900 [Thermoanaerobaculaceae bacterium]
MIRKSPETWAEAAIAGCCVAMLAGTYGRLLGAFFYADDLLSLWAVASTPLPAFFFSPERLRAMTTSFTPLQAVSYAVDWHLFGLKPLGSSIHNLVALVAALGLLYLVVRRWFSRLVALAAVALVIANPVTLSVATWAGSRHYIEGLAWALLALVLVRRAEGRTHAPWWAGAAALAACLDKEVFVALPAVSWLLITGPLQKRWRLTMPLWLAVAIYAPWRVWMMGGLGGYVDQAGFDVSTIVLLLKGVPQALAVHWFPGAVWLVSLPLTLAAVGAGRSLWRGAVIVGLLAAPLLPIAARLPVATVENGRFVFHLTVVLLAAAVGALNRAGPMSPPWLRLALGLGAAALAVLLVLENVDLCWRLVGQRRESSAEAAVFTSGTRAFVRARQPAYFYEGLRRLTELSTGRRIATELVPLNEMLAYCDDTALRAFESGGIAVPWHEVREARARQIVAAVKAVIVLDGYQVRWRFAASPDTRFAVVVGPRSGVYFDRVEMPAQGRYAFGQDRPDGAPTALFVRVAERLPDRREIVSPEVALTVPGKQTIDCSQARAKP